MKVSQKTEYAMRAMLELAIREDESATRSALIARNQQIPEKFLELILVELRRAGLVTSLRGPVGGHRLAKAPRDISVGDIWRAIEGPPAEPVLKQGSRADPFRHIWEATDKAVADVVDHVSLADVQKWAESHQGVPDFSI